MGTAGAAGHDITGSMWLLTMVAFTAILLFPATAVAQSDEEQNIEQLETGQQVYTDNCSGCHQPSGVGIPGSFPPLLDNPHVDDGEYVRGVVQNGLSGPIEVNGETYDGVMPSFSTLDDAQIEAVIAFLQNDLLVPGGVPPEAGDGAGAGRTLPLNATALISLAYMIVIGVAIAVLAPRVVGVIERSDTSRLDAGLKSGLIVIYFVAATVILPSVVLQTDVLARLPRGVQDFVATALWVGGLGIGVIGLWWLQKQDRI